MKSVECSGELTCIQLPGMPRGVGSCQNVHKLLFHGMACNQNEYCDAAKSLVCTNGACACSSERANTSPKYELVWDEVDNDCVAPVGAACIGTKYHPVSLGQKAIRCVVDAECVDAPELTPGVGICYTEPQPPVVTTTTDTPRPGDDNNDGNSAGRLFDGFKVVMSIAMSFVALSLSA